MRLRSLRALALAFLAVFLLVTIGTGVGIFTAGQAAIVTLVDRRIISESAQLTGPGFPTARAVVIDRIDDFISARDTGDIGVELTDGAGRHISGNIALGNRLPIGMSTLGTRTRLKGVSQGRAYVREIGDDMVLTLIGETEPVDDYNLTRLRIYLIGFGAIIVLVVGALLMFVTTISRRIAALNGTAEAIIDGDMLSRVPLGRSHSKFDEQARIFNRMLDRIGDLMAGLANISSDIAHDLRTPLARLRNQLTHIERHTEDPALRTEVETAIAQSDHLLAMFTAILRIVEVEGGDRRAAFAPVDLAALVRETGEMMAAIAEESGHVVTVTADDLAPLVGDRQLLVQAIINLIENALHHTPPGSRIALSVTRRTHDVVLVVTDDGPGIPVDQWTRALRRFGRVDRSRSRPGHGLGLPLIDAIVRLHRGTLELSDAAPGLRVTIVLPGV